MDPWTVTSALLLAGFISSAAFSHFDTGKSQLSDSLFSHERNSGKKKRKEKKDNNKRRRWRCPKSYAFALQDEP